jgi:hypothetical protein
MVSTRGLRIAVSIAVIGITGLSSGLASIGAASAAAAPTIVVTPSTNLHNGEAVHVSGHGFKAGDTVYIVECTATAKGQSGCKVAGIPPNATITATGLLPRTTFKVSTGKVGTGAAAKTCGTTKANLKSCAVSVGNITGGDSAVKIIAFK